MSCEADAENKKNKLTRIKQKPVIKNSEIKVEALCRLGMLANDAINPHELPFNYLFTLF